MFCEGGRQPRRVPSPGNQEKVSQGGAGDPGAQGCCWVSVARGQAGTVAPGQVDVRGRGGGARPVEVGSRESGTTTWSIKRAGRESTGADARGWGKRGGLPFKGHSGSVWPDERVLDRGSRTTWVCSLQKRTLTNAPDGTFYVRVTTVTFLFNFEREKGCGKRGAGPQELRGCPGAETRSGSRRGVAAGGPAGTGVCTDGSHLVGRGKGCAGEKRRGWRSGVLRTTCAQQTGWPSAGTPSSGCGAAAEN